MRKLKLFEHMSLDGVIQQSVDGDGFPYSDWTTPYRTPAGRDEVLALQGERFDLLLGRRTYDIFAAYWPNHTTGPEGGIGRKFDEIPKYVASRGTPAGLVLLGT